MPSYYAKVKPNIIKIIIKKTGITLYEWETICENAERNKKNGKTFREVLLKSLTEII